MIVTQETLENTTNSWGVYKVTLSVYGITSSHKVKIGLGSTNHWETIRTLIAQEYGKLATISKVETVKIAKHSAGIGTPHHKCNY